MKKSLLLSVSLIAALAFNSCIKSEELSVEDQMRLTANSLYNHGNLYQAMLFTPARIALRLNTLLYHAQLQQVDLTNATAGVTVDGIDCRAQLFANATFRVDGDLITVVYPYSYNYNTSTDSFYEGEVTFDTNGGLLGHSEWSVTTGGEDNTRLRLKSVNSYSGTSTTWFRWSHYALGTSWGVRAVGVENYDTGGEELASSWNCSAMTMTPDAEYIAQPSYANFKKLVVTMDGDCGGKVITAYKDDSEVALFYDANQVKVHYECNRVAALSGTETIYSNDLDPATFPSGEVSVTWAKTSAQCTRQGKMEYNGYSFQL